MTTNKFLLEDRWELYLLKKTLEMGTFSVALQVGDLAGQQFVEVEALVDTESTYTVLAKEVLDRLGLCRKAREVLNSATTG